MVSLVSTASYERFEDGDDQAGSVCLSENPLAQGSRSGLVVPLEMEVRELSSLNFMLAERRSSTRHWTLTEEFYNRPQGPQQKSEISGAVFNFTNSIVGSGIVGLPYALYRAGFFLGIAMMVLAAVLMDYAVYSMVECSRKVQQLDYELAVEFTLGTRGYHASAAGLVLRLFGVCVAYVIIITDCLTQVMDAAWGGHSQVVGQRWFVASVFCSVFILPLCFIKNMSSLTFTSTLSMASFLVIVLCICVQSPKEDAGVSHSINTLPFAQATVFSAMGTMTTAFHCSNSAYIIFNSLQNPTPARFKLTTDASYLLAFLFSIVPAVVGFLAFRSETEGNVLNNFGEHNVYINVARVLLAIALCFAFPKRLLACRHSLLNLMEVSGAIDKRSDSVFYVATAVLWLMAVAIGASITSLGPVLELTGTLTGAPLGFVLPGVVIYRIKDKLGDFKVHPLERAMPIFLVLFGMTITIIGTITVFVG